MALDGVFTGGTVSIGAGSTSVTGVGTTWLSLNVQPGDLLVVGGMMARIASVTSNTALTLARGWPGGAVSGADYDIYTISETGRALPAMNRIVQDLGSGNISSLAALNGAANKLPYFTGQGVMALANYGNAAGKTVQSGPLDTTPGRVQLVGGFGWGALGGGVSWIPDLDAFDTPTGVYGVQTATSGTRPDGASNFAFLRIERQASTAILQTWVNSNNQLVAHRTATSGVWDPWRRLDSQQGSNGNGEFVRFADGMQICRGQLTGINIDTAYGALYRSAALSWVFPAAFFGGGDKRTPCFR
ncbi:pyocin knob domain-containing protein [Ponticoccus litoralis]|uniref:Pyocin knob domain-containing protein n=1 Tax=Ponticoccus litoralis TaxID=422297 RepID=A0AAW9SQI0_9RHOB